MDHGKPRRISEAILIICLVLSLGCLILSLLTTVNRPPTSLPPPAGRTLDRISTEGAGSCSTARPEVVRTPVTDSVASQVTLIVTDMRTGNRVQNVRICATYGARTISEDSLVEVAAAPAGTACCDLSSLSSDPEGRIVLLAEGYLAAVHRVPHEAGVHELEMTPGRRVTARVETLNQEPVEDATVLFFIENLDGALLLGSSDSNAAYRFSALTGSWYVAATTRADGLASATVPQGKVNAVAECVGWFPVSAATQVPPGDLESAVHMRLVMEPVRCAVLFCKSGAVIGQSLATIVHRGWREVSSAYSFRAKDNVERLLARRFPGSTVIAECLIRDSQSRTGGQMPQASFNLMVDHVGLVDCKENLVPISEVSPRELAPPGRPVSQLGTMEMPAHPDYSSEWPAPFFVVRDVGEAMPVSFDARYGGEYSIEPGLYRVYQRMIGPTGKSEIATVTVEPARRCRVAFEHLSVRWPLCLSIRGPGGASPAFCTLRFRSFADHQGVKEWRASPRDASNFEVFLESGSHEISVSHDGRHWMTDVVDVKPGMNRSMLNMEW